jgi:hypothetical protein
MIREDKGGGGGNNGRKKKEKNVCGKSGGKVGCMVMSFEVK